jgi:hypothetical protein
MAAAPRDGGILERPGRALIALALVIACRDGAERSAARAFPIPGERGDRITVEVLNATPRPGLARTGTLVLRRAGIDVVYFGNASADVTPLDSTRIVVRRGDAGRGERVRAALRAGRVTVQPDSGRLLDVSVLLGADFAPRVGFHP